MSTSVKARGGSKGSHAPGLSQKDFRYLQKLAYDLWGLDITEKKHSLVENRLTSIARRQKIGTATDYLDRFREQFTEELKLELFDVLSTNLTSFFRDPTHFEVLDREIVQPWRKLSPQVPLRIWSAGCSKGCEPYSLSILLHDRVPELGSRNARILATDLASSVLVEAKRGVYDLAAVEGLPREMLKTHFLKGRGSSSGKAKVQKHLKERIDFSLLNLNDDWAQDAPFDSIFCRNVMIYFDAPTQSKLVRRFEEALVPGGILFLGTSENLPKDCCQLSPVGNACYKKSRGSS